MPPVLYIKRPRFIEAFQIVDRKMFRLVALFLALVSASAFVAPGHVASVSVRGSAVTMGAKKARPRKCHHGFHANTAHAQTQEESRT